MTTESDVIIAPDNTGTGAHHIRTVTVYPVNPVSPDYGEKQEVVTQAGSDGALVELTKNALPVHSPELALLLRAVILRLDLLNAAVDSKYTPPDSY